MHASCWPAADKIGASNEITNHRAPAKQIPPQPRDLHSGRWEARSRHHNSKHYCC